MRQFLGLANTVLTYQVPKLRVSKGVYWLRFYWKILMEGRYFTFTFNPIFATDDMIGKPSMDYFSTLTKLRLYFRFGTKSHKIEQLHFVCDMTTIDKIVKGKLSVFDIQFTCFSSWNCNNDWAKVVDQTSINQPSRHGKNLL